MQKPSKSKSQQFTHLLLRKVFSNFIFIDILSTLKLLPFDFLDAFTLDIAGTDQHTLERSETKVVVTL